MTSLERVLDRCDIGDCWLWQGTTSSGYGRISVNAKRQSVHRVVWEALVGPIPDGMQMDHLCRIRNCVNPDHLDVVTHKENLRRGVAPSARTKAYCLRGHSMSDCYIDKKTGKRKCRQCAVNRQRKYRPLGGNE